MKTALIVGAAALVVYAIWRTQKTVVTPGAATGNAVADMTPSAAARTLFGPAATVRGVLRRAVAVGPGSPALPPSYTEVLSDVAAREFAPLATPPAPNNNRYSAVGVRGVLGSAPDGTPGQMNDGPNGLLRN